MQAISRVLWSAGRGPSRFALRSGALTIACAAAALAMAAPAAHAYTFGTPAVGAAGPETTAFDWSADKCNDNDIPDQPSRAYRDASGKVVLINSHFTVRRKVGDTLATVTQVCSPIAMSSGNNADPSRYDDKEWVASPYTTDGGTTVYALIHSEFQGYNHSPGYCIRSGESFADKQKCWYNALTLAKSTNGGVTFSHAAPPDHYVGGPPYRYLAGTGPIGFFQPSNIVRGKDDLYYALVHVEDYGVQPYGSCLWRTADLADPQSWRAWDGTGFTVRFRDPYRYSYDPAEGVCAPVSRNRIGTLSESLTWSTYLRKWVLVGSSENADGVSGPGFYHYTSDDLVNWSPAKLLMKGELPWTYSCQDGPEQLRDPSLLDNDSESPNFETIGQRPFLYFTRFNVGFNTPTNCFTSLDRDLIRIPLEFSNQQPGGPVAALAASTQAPQTGQHVSFDASGSSDADGTIATYQWDLDGDGAYELNSGTDPQASRVYTSPDKVTVTVRVCDDDGKATDETTIVDVSGTPLTAQPPTSGDPPSGACPQPSGGGGGTTPGGGGGTTPGGGGTTPPGGSPGAAPGGSSAGTTAAAPAVPAGQVSKPAIGRFRILGKPVSRADGSLVLRIVAPSAGRLTVRGPGRPAVIRSARAGASKAGTLTVRVRPSAAGSALLRKKGRVKVKATLVFTPVAGSPQRSTRVLSLRLTRGR